MLQEGRLASARLAEKQHTVRLRDEFVQRDRIQRRRDLIWTGVHKQRREHIRRMDRDLALWLAHDPADVEVLDLTLNPVSVLINRLAGHRLCEPSRDTPF